jgi:sugar/nucleoside kinase (ribokinase family)
MDILVDVDPQLLSTVADKAGGCIPIDTAEMSRLLAITTSSSTPLACVPLHILQQQEQQLAALELTCACLSTCPARSLPGGSAANVLKGLANLSAGRLECSFMGMVGKDATAAEYTSKLQQQGVTPRLVVSGIGRQ